jgi:hypothetical protein
MIQRASSSFTVDNWNEETYGDHDGVTTGRASLTKTFHGDLDAASTVNMLMVGTPGGSRSYVALEQIVGSLHGRSGSFVLRHDASASTAGQTGSFLVVPDSGTGDLAGMRGTAEIVIAADGSHSLNLDYDLPAAAPTG